MTFHHHFLIQSGRNSFSQNNQSHSSPSIFQLYRTETGSPDFPSPQPLIIDKQSKNWFSKWLCLCRNACNSNGYIFFSVGNSLFGFLCESLVFWQKEQIALSLFFQIALFALFSKSDESQSLSFLYKSKAKSSFQFCLQKGAKQTLLKRIALS